MATQILNTIKNAGDFKLFSDSWSTYRDFICIEDVVRIILEYARLKPGVYDLGTGYPVSFGAISDYIKKRFGDEYIYTLIDNPYTGNYQKMTQADMSWLRNYMPEYKFRSIENGIDLMIQSK